MKRVAAPLGSLRELSCESHSSRFGLGCWQYSDVALDFYFRMWRFVQDRVLVLVLVYVLPCKAEVTVCSCLFWMRVRTLGEKDNKRPIGLEVMGQVRAPFSISVPIKERSSGLTFPRKTLWKEKLPRKSLNLTPEFLKNICWYYLRGFLFLKQEIIQKNAFVWRVRVDQ